MTTTLIRRAGVLVLIAATTTTLTGCAGAIGAIGAKMTYHDTEKTKITEIVLTGGNGDVVVTTAPVTETTITRVVRRSSDPGPSYRLVGTTLNIDASCGADCSVSYEIKAPAGVAVRGRLRGGDVQLDGVGTTELEVTTGDLTVRDATGPVQVRGTTGDLQVLNAKGPVKLQSTTGDVRALNAGGAVEARVTTGDIDVVLAAPHSVIAESTTGDVDVTVPQGSYKVVTQAGSGEVDLHGLVSEATATNVLDLKVSSGDINVASGA